MLACVRASDEGDWVAYRADLVDEDAGFVPPAESRPLLESIRPHIEAAAQVQVALWEHFGQTGPLMLLV